MEVSSVCLGALWGRRSPWTTPGRGNGREIVTSAAAFTPPLGTKVILVPIVGVEGQDDAIGVERWIEGLRACAPRRRGERGHPGPGERGALAGHVRPGHRRPAGGGRSRRCGPTTTWATGHPWGMTPSRSWKLLGERIAQVHIKGAPSCNMGRTPWT